MRSTCVSLVAPARALASSARPSIAATILALLLAALATLLSAQSLHAQAAPPCTQEYWCGMGLYPSAALEAQGAFEAQGTLETDGVDASETVAPLSEEAGSDFAQQTLVFQSLRDGNWEIYISRLDGVGRTRLTANEAVDNEPRLSPTMQSIAFVSDRDAEGVPNIYTMNLDGSNVRRLTHEWGATGPRWTPDGAWIYFTAWNVDDAGKVVDYDIKRVRVADGLVQTIVGGATVDFDVALKADGSELVWVRPVDGENGVLIRAKPDGSGARVFGPAHRFLGKPAWSPSGIFLSFEWANEEGWNSLSAHYFYNLFDDEDGSQNIVWIAGGGDNAGPWVEFTGSSWTHSYYSTTGISAMHEDRLLYTTYSYQLVEDEVVVSRRMAMAQYDSGLFQLFDELSPLSDTTLDANPDARWTDAIAPVTAIYPLPMYSYWSGMGQPTTMRWLNQDQGGSGLLRAEIQLSDSPCCKWNRVAWRLPTEWLEPCNFYVFDSTSGTPFFEKPFFRLRMVDRALNFSQWSPPASTQCYSLRVQTHVTDVRGFPLGGVRYGDGISNPQGFSVQFPSGLQGDMSALTWQRHILDGIQVTLPGYRATTVGALSTIYGMPVETPTSTYFVSPAGPDLIDDGGFAQGLDSPNWHWVWTFAAGERFDGMAAAFSAQESPHATSYVAQDIGATPEWASIANPTLTFAYRFNNAFVGRYGPPTAAQAGGQQISPEESRSSTVEAASVEEISAGQASPYFEVIIRETTEFSDTEIVTDTVVLRRTTFTDWRIAWVDMTPWQGKAITVLFAMQNPELVGGDYFAVVDNVSLSPWRTPQVSAMTPTVIEAPLGATLTITGGNFIGTPAVRLGRTMAGSGTPIAADDGLASSQEITLDPATVIRNGDTLTATLPANLAPGVYNVLVINPGGDRTVAPQTLTIGEPVWLPRISQ